MRAKFGLVPTSKMLSFKFISRLVYSHTMHVIIKNIISVRCVGLNEVCMLSLLEK